MKKSLFLRLQTNSRLIAKTLFIGIFMIVLLTVVGIITWHGYRDTIIESQTAQLELVVDTVSDMISFTLDEYVSRLEAAVVKAQQHPNEIPNLSVSDTVVDIWFEDSDGNFLESRHGVFAESDRKLTETNGIEYWQYHNGDRHYLVLKKKVNDKYVCLVTDSEKYYSEIVSDIRVGANGYFVIKSSENVIIMHPVREQWGKDTVNGRLQLYSDKNLELNDLEDLLQAQLTEESAVMDYYSYWWSDPDLPRVHKVSAFQRIKVGDDFWTASAVLDYDDLYKPVSQSFQKLLIFFVLLMGFVILTTVYIFKLLIKNRNSARKIDSLEEINSALEELHRSEETLAHSQRLQLMGTLTGGIAHEFNNFLTPITGYADLIMADSDPESEIYDNALEISEAAEKAKDVVKQISSMSRKNIETVYDTVDVKNLLEQTLKLVHTNLPKNVKLKSDTETENALILGNATQLQQVLLNISVNAIHAMKEGGGTLTISDEIVTREDVAKRFTDENIPEQWKNYVLIRISDTGAGMSKDVLERIFDPFFTTKKTGEGTGLGLSIAEQIIRTHKGRITAESEVGKGSEFFIYLPCLEQTQNEEQLGWGQRHNLNILIADDNRKVLSMLEKDLGSLDMTVKTASKLEDIRRLLDETPFDVLLIDESLSNGSGVNFCMSIQNRFRNLTRIIMTSSPNKEIIEAKRHKIIDGYIVKPVAASTLMEVIRTSKRQ